MARKLRLEFPGACYHVINRGNYRSDIFRHERTKAAFEACLFEACEKSGWLLHAFTIMRNHYHLAVETPQGNLAAGMQWLQSTFANRFNRFRGEHGHLFQGRYKAPLVEEGDPLGLVCHYIHLNPVRADICTVERLGQFRYSSYWYLRHPHARPGFLRPETALMTTGGLADTLAGWKCYDAHLDWQVAEGPAGKSKAYRRLSRGWALGSKEFKASLLRDHAVLVQPRMWEIHGAREMRELQWQEALTRALEVTKLKGSELASLPKSSPEKLAVAAWMKTRTQASNGWLSQRLALGSPAALSRNLTHYRRSRQATDRLWKQLTSISAA